MHMLVKNSQNKWSYLTFDQIFIVPISEESGKSINWGIYLTISPLFKKRRRLLSRLLAAKFRPIRMQQNSNLHTVL